MKNTVEKKSFPPDIFSNDHKCPNTEFQPNTKKCGSEKTPYLDTFQAVDIL